MKNSRPMLGRYVIPDMPSADELLPLLRRIDSSRWYSNFGPLVLQFEAQLAEHLSSVGGNARSGSLSLLTLASCYHALKVGLQLLRLPPSAHVLVPAITFPACPFAVRHAGAVPVLADIDRVSWTLTPEIARRIAAKMPIHAVMPVALYGVPVPVDAWDRFVDETGIPVIIDAAAALEAQAVPVKALLAHSLHATKPFSIGEGGVLVCRNQDLIEEARRLSNFGMQMRIAVQDGGNAKMSEYHAAVALAQLARWPEVKKRRQKVFALYQAALEKTKLGVALQPRVENSIVSTLMLQSDDFFAPVIADELNAQGIAAHRMYMPPLYCHPHFEGLMVVDGQGNALRDVPFEQKAALMVNSEIVHKSVFGVPFHAFMGEEDIACIVEALADTMEKPQAKIAAR